MLNIMKRIKPHVKIFMLIFFSMYLCLLSSSCHKWVYDGELNGIQFKKVRYSTSDSDTISIIGYIDENKVINEIPCAAGWVHFTSDWKLKLFCLSETSQIKNVVLPSGTWVVSNYTEESLVVVFPDDTIIGTFPVKGGGGSKGVHTSFYDDGNLKSFFAFEKFEHIGVTYKKSIFNSINLTEEGTIIE